MSGLKYWLWLSTLKGIGIITAKNLIDFFGSPKDIYFAREKHFNSAGITSKAELDALGNKNLDRASLIWRRCDELDIRILTMQDAEYPVRLLNIYDPPILLYIKGRMQAFDEEAAIGMVGTRRATPYGLRVAEQLAYEVTKEGGLIVSGLADGIDTAAIRGSLRGNGKPVGILGTGVDIVYPQKNRYIQDDVGQVGTLISEFPPGTQPNSANFPQRNRLISGISAGVVIIEAPRRSGALITASRALEQGRDVFVVPGNIDSPACEGSNELLKEKYAIAVTSGWDILREYERVYPDKILRIAEKLKTLSRNEPDQEQNTLVAGPITQYLTQKSVDNKADQEYIDIKAQLEELSEDEICVVSVMQESEMHIDDIIELTGQPPSIVMSALTSLELKGYAAEKRGRRYSLVISKGKA